MLTHDPRALLFGEVREIIERAENEGRDLTAVECEQCSALTDAVGYLNRFIRVSLADPDYVARQAERSKAARMTLRETPCEAA